MSTDRRLEYEKGPRPEEGEPSDESDGGAEPSERERLAGPIAAAVAGLVSGASAFAAVLAVTYQLVASMDAAGYFGSAETEPGRWTMTRLIGLANHGVPMEVGGEPLQSGVSVRFLSGLASHVTALIPAVVLFAAGYLLVRHVRLETRRDAGIAVGSLVASYVVLAVVTAWTTEWTPEGMDAETVAFATDFGAILSVARTAVVFAAIGAGLAALPRVLEATPLEPVEEAD